MDPLWRGALFVLLLCTGCQEAVEHTSRATLNSSAHGGNNGVLVFHLSDSVDVRIPGSKTPEFLALFNGAERLDLTQQDGCYTVPVFDGSVCLNGEGHGQWTDVLRTGEDPYEVHVSWRAGEGGQAAPAHPHKEEVWRLTFGNEDPWFGDLVMRSDRDGGLTGTIETATGDFRYLHGSEDGGNITLQTFDGAHLFLFSARRSVDGGLTAGWFYSGNHYSTPFVGSAMTEETPALNDGMKALWTGQPVAYSGLNLVGDSVSWNWEPTDTAVHILSIMGSWCPNCMDEHRLLASLLDSHPHVIVHTLAFERGLDRESGEKRALNRLKAYSESMEMWRHEGRWSIALAGPASKQQAQKALPFLDRVVSFPTTLVLRPNAKEPWIHSGFNGPATGVKHTLEQAAFVEAISGSSESR